MKKKSGTQLIERWHNEIGRFLNPENEELGKKLIREWCAVDEFFIDHVMSVFGLKAFKYDTGEQVTPQDDLELENWIFNYGEIEIIEQECGNELVREIIKRQIESKAIDACIIDIPKGGKILQPKKSIDD